MSAHPMSRAVLFLAGGLLLGAGAGDLTGQGLALSHPVMIFSGRAGGPDPAPQQLTIQSVPAATGWTVSGTLPAWLTVAPATGTAPGNITLTVRSGGLAPGFYHVQLTVTCGSATRTVEVILVITDVSGRAPTPGPGIPIPPLPPLPPLPPGITDPEVIRRYNTPPARYLVEFMYIGYSGLLDGYPACKVNPQGFDHMIGVLAGIEVNTDDEDITYTGVMHRYTEIDFCDVKPAPTEDQTKFCAADLHGEATMKVELEVYGEEGRGAWLKVEPTRGKMWRTVGGDCTGETNHDIEAEYPNSSHAGGGSPGGQPILEKSVQFFNGGVARLRVGHYPAQKPESVWSMRVIARLYP